MTVAVKAKASYSQHVVVSKELRSYGFYMGPIQQGAGWTFSYAFPHWLIPQLWNLLVGIYSVCFMVPRSPKQIKVFL